MSPKKKLVVHDIPIGYTHDPKDSNLSPHVIDLREESDALAPQFVQKYETPQTHLNAPVPEPYRRVKKQKKHALKLNFMRNTLTLEERLARMRRRARSWKERILNISVKVFSPVSTQSASVFSSIKNTLKDSSAKSFKLFRRSSAHYTEEAADDVAALDEGREAPDAPVAVGIWRRAEIVTFLSVLCGLILTVKAAGTIDYYRQLRGSVLGEAVEGVQALSRAQNAFHESDIPEAIASFLAAQDKFAEVSRTLDDLPFSSVLEKIPPLRSNVALLSVGEDSSRAAEYTLLAFKALDGVKQSLEGARGLRAALEGGEGSGMNVPVNELERASRYLGEAVTALREANLSAATINLEDLPEEYQGSVASFLTLLSPSERLLSQTQRGIALFASFLGSERPRRIIVAFQNDAELRPTGGFMGSYALLDTNRGSVESIDVPGGGLYDLKGSLQTRVDAPYPFHLFSPVWQPWNANWFFDFPSSARTLTWFVEKSQGPTVDGVIAVTPVLLEDLLRITGPLTLPEYQLVVSDKNVRRVLQDAVEVEYDKSINRPKQIIGDLLPLILTRVSFAFAENFPQLLNSLAAALDRHDLLLWSSFEGDQNMINASGWGGVVEPTASDYLALVHTNIGGGKTDRVMAERWERTMTLAPDGTGEAFLAVTREHRGDAADLYEKVHNVDYVRIFVPRGSVFLGAEGFTAPDDALFKYDETLPVYPELEHMIASTKIDDISGIRITEEHGFTVFGGWVMTKVGGKSVYRVHYRIPPVVKFERGALPLFAGEARRYELFVQRQPGALDTPFTNTLTVPPEWGNEVLFNGASSNMAGNSIAHEYIIDRDMISTLVWQ